MRLNLMAMLGLVAFAALWRLFPHPENMTPVAAVALFAGARLRNPAGRFLLPLGAMFLSDLVLGFHATVWFVYGAMVGGALLGTWLRGRGILSYAGMSVANSLLFFVVTNFGVWAVTGMYSANAGGFISCYAAALPFLWKTLAGDLFFTMAIFALFSLVDHYAGDVGSARIGARS